MFLLLAFSPATFHSRHQHSEYENESLRKQIREAMEASAEKDERIRQLEEQLGQQLAGALTVCPERPAMPAPSLSSVSTISL